jgi:hypothetical protein
MTSNRPRPNAPDENQDVIVHYIKEIQVPSNREREYWMLWHGQERLVDYATYEQAIIAAQRLSANIGRPAWLLDKAGYPLKPIDPA